MSELQDMPRRSSDGLAVLDMFYEGYNDINFYVEDEDQENLYEIILGKLFPDVSISKIFPLGGKGKVLEHARTTPDPPSGAYRVYLVDKDFDDFLGTKTSIDKVYYLDWFCIENYLLEERAAIEVVLESHPKLKRRNIEDNLKIKDFFSQAYEESKAIFAIYFFVQQNSIGIKNTSCAPQSYCKETAPWQVCSGKISDYLANVCAEASRKGIKPLLNDLSLDERIKVVLLASAPHAVSGKHMAARLFHYIKSKYSLGSITFDSFVYRLAKNCGLDTLHNLRDAVLKNMEIKETVRSRITIRWWLTALTGGGLNANVCAGHGALLRRCKSVGQVSAEQEGKEPHASFGDAGGVTFQPISDQAVSAPRQGVIQVSGRPRLTPAETRIAVAHFPCKPSATSA